MIGTSLKACDVPKIQENVFMVFDEQLVRKKMLKSIASIAGGVATLLGLYLVLVQTTAISVALTSVEADGTKEVLTYLIFTNDGDTVATISEVDLFFTDSSPSRNRCTGVRIGRQIFSPTGADGLILKPNEQISRTFTLNPNFEKVGSFSLCAIFDVNYRSGDKKTDAILLFDFAVLENELDSPDLDNNVHSLVQTRTIRRF